MNASTSITSLLVNQLRHAYGVVTPSFGWKMESGRPGAAQAAYRLRVYEGRAAEGAPVWDSGEVATSDSLAIRYAGPTLRSARAYSWRVAVKDETGAWTESDAAVFETALTDEAAWAKADWISVGEPLRGDRDTAAFFKPVANAKAVREKMIASLRAVNAALGDGDAAQRAARAVLEAVLPQAVAEDAGA